MATVKIQGITKSYQPGVPVLRPIDLTVEDGELFFLLGPSGCGKSTLLRILSGLVTPDAGQIHFGETEVTKLPPEKRHTAMVFQNYALWPHLTVFENVAFGLRAEGVAKGQIEPRVMEALKTVQLDDCAKRRIPSLSGGQQQRIALARALAVNPTLLLLDEPLSNLDARLRDTMRREIRRICKERKLTAIYVTHDRQEALSMADRLAVMHEGVIQQLGRPEEVYNLPRNRFVASFLGDVNLLAGKTGPDRQFSTPFGRFPLTGKTSDFAAIRPERILFADEATPDAFPATIVERTFLGESCEWRLDANGVSLLVVESAPPVRQPGDRVFLRLQPGHLISMED